MLAYKMKFGQLLLRAGAFKMVITMVKNISIKNMKSSNTDIECPQMVPMDRMQPEKNAKGENIHKNDIKPCIGRRPLY